MTGLLLPTIVTAIRTRVDGGLGFVLETQELSPSKAGELFALRGKTTMTYISPKETISQKEIDQVNAIDAEIDGKTPSQRLRNVIYVLYTQRPEEYKDFDSFYKYKMNIIIEHLKSKLQ